MRRFGRVPLLAVVLVLALVAAACGGEDGNGDGDGGATGETGVATGGTEATGGEGDGATIIISGFAFSPATLEVSGETTITVTNEDGAAHTFTLDDGSVDERVEGGETVEVMVNPSETAGYHCAIHPQMTGTLEVA